MSKKQTAVQYVEELIKIILYNIDSDELERIQEVFDEAIQMEKEQVISALKAGVNFEINLNIDSNTNLTYKEYFEKYYNKTYKKKRYE